MPAEWEPQTAIWLSWPHKRASWPGLFRPVPYTFARIVAQISRFEEVRINADVVSLPGMSAHADASQIIAWLKTLKKAPGQVYLTHGEPAAADALRWRIEHELRWKVSVPMMGDRVTVPM